MTGFPYGPTRVHNLGDNRNRRHPLVPPWSEHTSALGWSGDPSDLAAAADPEPGWLRRNVSGRRPHRTQDTRREAMSPLTLTLPTRCRGSNRCCLKPPQLSVRRLSHTEYEPRWSDAWPHDRVVVSSMPKRAAHMCVFRARGGTRGSDPRPPTTPQLSARRHIPPSFFPDGELR